MLERALASARVFGRAVFNLYPIRGRVDSAQGKNASAILQAENAQRTTINASWSRQTLLSRIPFGANLLVSNQPTCCVADTFCFNSQRSRQGAVRTLWDASACQIAKSLIATLPSGPHMSALRKSKAARPHTSKGFNARAFYEVLSSIVEARSVAWRQVARETGITPSTLTRMGQGRQPDAPSLAALAAWAGLNPADFVGQPTETARSDPLVVIARALRSDPGLQPDAAKALEDIMRIAYDRFSRQTA